MSRLLGNAPEPPAKPRTGYRNFTQERVDRERLARQAKQQAANEQKKENIMNGILTDYNGLQFQSRADARYGEFFQTLAINYQYGTDFWLPRLKCIAVIMALKPTKEEALIIAARTDKIRMCLVLNGTLAGEIYAFWQGVQVTFHHWVECASCHQIGIAILVEGYPMQRMPCTCWKRGGVFVDELRIHDAYEVALNLAL